MLFQIQMEMVVVKFVGALEEDNKEYNRYYVRNKMPKF